LTFRDDQWLTKLRGLGLSYEDEWKLANLRPHIWKVSQLIAKYVSLFGKHLMDSSRTKKEDKPTSIIHSNAIDLNTLDIKPTNIFFFHPDNENRE